MKCEMMNKNRPIAEIEGKVIYNARNMNMPAIEAESIRLTDPDFAPIALSHPKKEYRDNLLGAFKEWFYKRLISKDRPDIPKQDVMPAIWAKTSNEPGKIAPNFFSLTDQYWFRYDPREEWEKLNYFNNPFNPFLGELFFSNNQGEVKEAKYYFNSPDFVTNGIQPKRWLRREYGGKKRLYLYKTARNGHDKSVFCETMASKALKKMNCISFVEYVLDVTNFRLCSRCQCFIKENEELVPASHICKAIDNEDNIDVYMHLIRASKEFGIEKVEPFVDMMIEVDRRLLNFDRHLGNFGFIRDVDTGKFKGPAPLYDFGSAYFVDDEVQKGLKDMKQEHYFANREKKLIRDGKIKQNDPIDLAEALEEAATLPIAGLAEEINKINGNINLSNNYIVGLSMEHDNEVKKQHAHKKGGDKNKDSDKSLVSVYNGY